MTARLAISPKATRRFSSIFAQSILSFLVRYRRTALGPIWLLVGPSLFIAVIGVLYASINQRDLSVFIPYMATGLIYWTILSGFVNGAPSLFVRNKGQIMQGNMGLQDIAISDLVNIFIGFAHQTIIIFVVMFIYDIGVTLYSLVAIVGLVLALINGYWVNIVFGILGARYRDLAELFPAIMRIAFLATPIVWLPSARGEMAAAFQLYNPFHHFMDLFRAPLLNEPISPVSWLFVLTVTLVGLGVANFMRRRYGPQVALWI